MASRSPWDETLGAYMRLTAAWLRHYASPLSLLRGLWRPATLGVAYVVIGFVTFGHVASANYRADQHEYEECDRNRRVNEGNSYNSCWQPDAVIDAGKGVGAGVFWPLYLSWELQQ